MSDIYDEAVEYLSEHPRQIYDAWDFEHSILFRRIKRYCGCLTQIHGGTQSGPNLEITESIRTDERIPDDGRKITVASLPVFAEWNRRLDKELNRPVPTTIGG